MAQDDTAAGERGPAVPTGPEAPAAPEAAAADRAEQAERDGGPADASEHAGRSRRFPLITEDTARPEGGGRAAPGDAPAPARQWPILAVAAGVLTGLLLTLASFRAGTLTIGLSLLAGGLLRWFRPTVGMLAVRSRFTDVVTYALLGGVITLLAMMAQPDPWVTIPFLDDIVHFTVR
ncbi:DUF3017 domain-containing protein [Streptomyces sp. TR02-1]|uniref:DUF3017 domain-containing protein n=1 Tax=Streptomyces sp. TR02-1 TaxID=3385977 RepID=UPI0039A08B5A